MISTREQDTFLAIEKMRIRMTRPAYTFDELITLTKNRELPKTATKMKLLKKFTNS